MKKDNELVNRIMMATGYKTQKDLAKALKLSPSDLNNRIKSGSIIKLLIDFAVHENVNVNWLVTGQGNMKVTPITGMVADSESPEYTPRPRETDFMRMFKLLETSTQNQINEISKRLDDAVTRINGMLGVIKNASDLAQSILDDLHKQRSDGVKIINNLEKSINRLSTRSDKRYTELHDQIIMIERMMFEAANLKDITRLGKTGEKGK